MAKYQNKPETVEAVKLDPSTGQLRLDENTVAQPGEWLVKHPDGRWSSLNDEHFQQSYAPYEEQPVDADGNPIKPPDSVPDPTVPDPAQPQP